MNEIAVLPNQKLAEGVDLFLRNAVALNTRQTYGRAVEVYLEWMEDRNPLDVAFATAVDYREFLVGRYSAGTAASYLAAIKSFYRLMKGLGLVAVDIWPLVKTPSAPNLSATQAIAEESLVKIKDLVQAWPLRDRLIFRLLYEAGMRREEVAGITKDALAKGRDGYYLTITGKGDKTRLVGLTEDLAGNWLKHVETTVSRYVFPGRFEGHLTPRMINKIIDRLGEEVHPHRLRHQHVTEAHEAGVQLADISTTVGHSDPRTTMRYLDSREAVIRSSARVVGAKKG